MALEVYTYDYLIDALNDAKVTSRQLIKDINDIEFKTRPADDEWSVGEILSHLIESGREYLGPIKKALSEDKLPKGNEPFAINFLMRQFVKQVSPENPRALPTVALFSPVEIDEYDKLELLNEFHSLQSELIKILIDSREKGIDLEDVKIKNPVLNWIKMSIVSCYAVIEAHQRRHFYQMARVIKTYRAQYT